MISWFRFVPHDEMAAHERQGWIVVARLGPVHGAYAVLMRWTGEDEPSEMADAAVEETCRAWA